MKIYIPTIKNYYEFFNIKDLDYELMSQIYKTLVPLKESWKIKELKTANGGRCKKADVACCSSSLVAIGQKIYDEIQEIFMNDEVEILPAKHNDDMYYIPRGLKAYEVGYDMKSMEDHTMKYFFDINKLIEQGIDEKYCFRAATKGKMIVTQTFFTQKFVDLLKEKKVKGIDFDLLWDSEAN